MSEQFQGRILAVTALAALMGMDGLFSLIDHEIRGAGQEPAIHAQSNPAENIVMRVPHIAPEPLCTQNDLSLGDESEVLNNEAVEPLMDEEFERIEWNEDQKDILRNASNTAFGQMALHRSA